MAALFKKMETIISPTNKKKSTPLNKDLQSTKTPINNSKKTPKSTKSATETID